MTLNFSPILYWLFNYLFDIILSVIWFCYLLAVYCILYIAFNGSPNSRPKSASILPFEFASLWDLRVQFYPLTILIVLPTLPFVYLLTKIFRNDILVRSFYSIAIFFEYFNAGWINNMACISYSSYNEYRYTISNDDY
jgi:hypothetical protein